MIRCKVIDKVAIIEDEITGIITWQGKPCGCSVIRTISQMKMGCAVLLDYDEFSKSEYRGLGNIILLDNTGNIVWHAETPEANDAFTYMDVEKGDLIANSWNGFRVVIDTQTGKLTKKMFVK